MGVWFRRVVVLGVALGLTLMVFFGAGYFGAVWSHYFSGDSEQKSASEVSVKLLPGKGTACPAGRRC